MDILSSYEEASGNENTVNRNTTSEVLSSYDTDAPLMEDNLTEDDIDPVEEFFSDQEDAFSDVSDFSNKDSIHVFSQSQKSMIPTETEHAYTTQEELSIIPIDSTQEEGEEVIVDESFEYKGKPLVETLDTVPTEIIGPEDFLYSQKSAKLASQPIANALDSALLIIKRDMEEFREWQTEVDWKINRFGSVINAYYNDESVHILRVVKSWVENSLVFARCSMLEKEQVESMIQNNHSQGSPSTEGDTVQDFPEPLPPPPVPDVNDTEVDVLFIFSFAMNPHCSIEAMRQCKVVAVWEPTFDVNDITLTDYPDTSSVSTITRFKIVA